MKNRTTRKRYSGGSSGSPGRRKHASTLPLSGPGKSIIWTTGGSRKTILPGMPPGRAGGACFQTSCQRVLNYIWHFIRHSTIDKRSLLSAGISPILPGLLLERIVRDKPGTSILFTEGSKAESQLCWSFLFLACFSFYSVMRDNMCLEDNGLP